MTTAPPAGNHTGDLDRAEIHFPFRPCKVSLRSLCAGVVCSRFRLSPMVSRKPWGLGLQMPGSPIEARVYEFHTFLLWTISLICVFVLVLLIYVILRYNKARKPDASTTDA